MFNRCLDCALGKAAFITDLKDNVVALENELQQLIAAKNDVMTRVLNAEHQPKMKRLHKVHDWLSRVETLKTEVDELMGRDGGSQEIDKLCLGGYCSRNCKSSYKFGRKVAKRLRDVKALKGEGVFEEVAAPDPELISWADERHTEPTVVGLQSQLEQVWRCLVQEPAAGIIGLYGMGGVGKTTLLTQINNKFVDNPTDFDYVIWVVVSKDLQLEKIQETIGKKIGLYTDSWKDKRLEEKAQDIFKTLSKKKFALLLDDLWERVDLKKVGVPLPSRSNSPKNSAVVFTTRFVDVCGRMEDRRMFKVACLSDEDAWELFREKVGEETIESHHSIPELAQTVAKECDGLPLALITIGRAMAYKKTPEEWRYAIEVLRRSASEFEGLGKEVYPLLKFSYDCLPNDAIRSCFLYCCLYPEDYSIYKRDLIDCWICEGFLDEAKFGTQNQGYHIVTTLVRACLLEEVEDDQVKMHDVIRDMALWITCEIEKEKEGFLVYAGSGLTEAPADVRGWEMVRRLSLMRNSIDNLPTVPTCPHLLTLFLNDNELTTITDDFFQSMPCLTVLKMSDIRMLQQLPMGISKLVSLQLLDISNTEVEELPEELKALVNLKCLNLDWTDVLVEVPQQLLSNFSRLRVLRMFATGIRSVYGRFSSWYENVAEELLGLKHLEVLEITFRSFEAYQTFLSSQKLRSCTQAPFLYKFDREESIDVADLANLEQLNTLYFRSCGWSGGLKIDYKDMVQKSRQPYVFRSLDKITVSSCRNLKHLTFLVFAPNLKSISVTHCDDMEEIISAGEFDDIPEMTGIISSPFAKLQHLELWGLKSLKSIYWKPLPLPRLKELEVEDCHSLKKLPLDSNSAKGRRILIRGDEDWWRRLQWEDEATQNAFRLCFQPL
ncbi:Disease resistance protein SUMM2 [Citrus sinensis]|uniref:Disease resistance protein SUMM2 n=1 Tax=Citrus sinensis TaxID=2711 RepID=A0ACB8LDC8_CITSI|nr:Disease resistance protein SUMM2 [Citrus sinensis]